MLAGHLTTVGDASHEEGISKEAGCSKNAVSKSMLKESWVEEKLAPAKVGKW